MYVSVFPPTVLVTKNILFGVVVELNSSSVIVWMPSPVPPPPSIFLMASAIALPLCGLSLVSSYVWSVMSSVRLLNFVGISVLSALFSTSLSI